ncbi:MAG: glycosyltransferase family 4 protein [bacterium]|nr:glycosyltransferase family 4 protein [bacterium]
MKRLKIAQIATASISLRFLLLRQIKYLMDEGYEVKAVSSDGGYLDEVREAGVEIKTINIDRKIKPLADLVSLIKLIRYFKKERFDIVHTHTAKAGFLGRLAARITGVPIIIHTAHGFPFQPGLPGMKDRFYFWLEKFTALLSDRILSQNSEDVQTALRLGLVKPDKIREIGNGIDLGLFDPDRIAGQINVEEKRRELFGDSGRTIFLTIAEMIERKGLGYLLKAISQVVKEERNCGFVLVGDGPLRAGLEAQAEELGLCHHVRFLGFRTDIPLLFSLVDGYILSSLSEGLPRSIIEAMAMTRPVIATDVKGSREMVKDGETGFLVPAQDPAALSRAILKIIRNKAEAKAMGLAGRERAKRFYNETDVMARLNGEYQELLRLKGLLRSILK